MFVKKGREGLRSPLTLRVVPNIEPPDGFHPQAQPSLRGSWRGGCQRGVLESVPKMGSYLSNVHWNCFFSDFQTNPAENLVEKDNERHLSFRSGAGTEPENGGLTWQWWAGHAFRLDQSFLLRESIWVAGIRIWENLVCLVCLKGLNEIVSERKLNQECLLDTGLICILCFSPRKKWNTIWTPAWTSWEKRFAEFCILNRRSRLSPAAAAWVFIY